MGFRWAPGAPCNTHSPEPQVDDAEAEQHVAGPQSRGGGHGSSTLRSACAATAVACARRERVSDPPHGHEPRDGESHSESGKGARVRACVRERWRV